MLITTINRQAIKTLKRILVGLLILIGIIPFAGYVALQFPWLQTTIARRTVSSFGEKVNGKLGIDRIAIIFFNKVIIYDASVIGEYGDTLGAFDKISISLSTRDLLHGKIVFNNILLNNGCFYYKTEDSPYKHNIGRIFNITPTPDSLKKGINIPDFTIKNLTLNNITFGMESRTKQSRITNSECIDFTDLLVKDINARFLKIKYDGTALSCSIRHLECIEKCGYGIKSLTGSFSMDSDETRIDNLLLIDNYSKISAGYLSFGYSSGKDLQDFVNKINMKADFKNTAIDFRSIGVFAQSLSGNPLKLMVNGTVSGPVRALSSNNLTVTSGHNTVLNINTSITGLPNIHQTLFDISFHEATTNAEELSFIISCFSKKGENARNSFPNDKFTFQGDAYGYMSDISLNGTITSDIGNAECQIAIQTPNANNREKTSRMNIKSFISVHDVLLGEIINNPDFGKASMSLHIDAGVNTKSFLSESDINIQPLEISHFNFKGHDYRNIKAFGKLENGEADIRLLSHDESLSTIIQTVMNFDRSNNMERFRLFLDIPYANLHDMNLTKNTAMLGMNAKADLKFKNKSIFGTLHIRDINFTDDYGVHIIESLNIKSLLHENRHLVSLDSPLLTAKYNATGSPSDIAARLQTYLLHPAFPEVFQEKQSESTINNDIQGEYSFTLSTLDMSPICDIFVPGLQIPQNTTLDITLDKNNICNFNFNSPKITYNNNRLRNIAINLTNKNGIKASISSDLAYIGGAFIADSKITANSNGNGVDMRISYNNADTSSLDFNSSIRLIRNMDGEIRTYLNLDTSTIILLNREWTLSPTELIIGKQYYSIDKFNLSNIHESLKIDGVVSKEKNSQVSVNLNNFNISLLNSFFTSDLGLHGYFSGEMKFNDVFTGMGANITLTGSDVRIKGQQIDSLSIMSRRDNEKKRFNLLINNYNNGKNPLNASGYFIPERKIINLNSNINALDLSYISPFLDNFLNISSGTFSGNITVSGPLDKLVLTGEDCRLDSVLLTPSYTKVPYIIHGPIHLNEKFISFTDLQISDFHNGNAILSGNISHKSLKDMYIDANLTFNNLLALNTTEYDNSTFYGTAYASGLIAVTGPFNDLNITAQVSTNDNTAIHVPLSSGSSATTTDLITYINPKDTAISDLDDFIPFAEKKKKQSGNLQIFATAAISPGTEILIEMNKQYGEILKCIGSGNIDVNLNPSKNYMDLRGGYTVSEGNYHLALAGIQSRDFIINEGGSISFNGDLKNTNINVGATYRTKASISTLIADTTSVGNRRNVNCGINISGSLSSPQIDFSIDIPDLDPITKGRVESALSTPGKVQKQLMSLLISGSFVPDEQSGIINNSSLLYSNASEILANQFNNIFRQLDIPLDLGLNYQPGTGGEKDLFDVAISYQAFNNRLVINGNVGNSQTSSNWAGDFEVEFKVDKRGKLRITLFTRSSDTYSNYLDNTQRSGFGVTFQDEFDTFGDLWRNLFYSKKRKEEYELKLLKKAEEDLKREAEEALIKKEEILRPKENPIENINNQVTVYQEDTM